MLCIKNNKHNIDWLRWNLICELYFERLEGLIAKQKKKGKKKSRDQFMNKICLETPKLSLINIPHTK